MGARAAWERQTSEAKGPEWKGWEGVAGRVRQMFAYMWFALDAKVEAETRYMRAAGISAEQLSKQDSRGRWSVADSAAEWYQTSGGTGGRAWTYMSTVAGKFCAKFRDEQGWSSGNFGRGRQTLWGQR